MQTSLEEELEKAWSNAYSIESRKAPGRIDYIGSLVKGDRMYLFYKDKDNRYWYRSKIQKE